MAQGRCATTARTDIAPITWEHVTNVSDAPVTLQDVVRSQPEMEVVLAMVVRLDGESQSAPAAPVVKYQDGDGVLGSPDPGVTADAGGKALGCSWRQARC
jgi:hypothetical protein